LSAGISPENMASHIRQRQRWARGTLQVLFIPSNPITIPGLSFLQRIAHFEGLLQWLSSTFRAVFLFLPIILATLDAVPLQSTLEEWLSFFLPFYLLTLSTFCWFSFRSRSALFSDVYNVIGCIPLTSVIIQTLIAPFTEPFRVTPKGQTPQRFSYNWRLAFPLFIALGAGWGLFYFHFLSPRASSPLGENIAGYQGILAILALYNMVVLCVALIGLIDVPKTPISETGYAIATPIALRASRGIYRGTTCKLAEKWVELELACPGELAGRVAIEFWEENFNLKGRIVWNRGNRYRIAFEPMAIAQYRRLVELIFCRPGRWQQADHPGELKTLWLLFSRLGYPFQLWWRSRRDFARFNPVSIAPVSIAENPHPSKR
jgi:cellulose synthase (UDP-forming)